METAAGLASLAESAAAPVARAAGMAAMIAAVAVIIADMMVMIASSAAWCTIDCYCDLGGVAHGKSRDHLSHILNPRGAQFESQVEEACSPHG